MKTDATVSGANLISGTESAEGTDTFQASNPSTGDVRAPVFYDATPAEVARSSAAAAAAYRELRGWSSARIAELLRQCAKSLSGNAEELLEVTAEETGLPLDPRLRGELARACLQFDMFADLVESGEHRDVVVDHADTTMTPPRPDIRRMRVGIGPVAVFGAANFPLAISAAGSDTASALAAGCPVVIKAHPSHPATSELSARALIDAANMVGAPDGTVNMVQGKSKRVGEALVLASEIRAVGFTGSPAAGNALVQLGATREHPIPVHAEMGSLNPVLITHRAVASRGEQLAEQLAASLQMGVGQFCTSPGLVFVPEGQHGDDFVEALRANLEQVGAGVLLNQGIRDNLAVQLEATRSVSGVTALLDGTPDPTETGPITCASSLFSVDLDTYLANDQLRHEHFGPSSMIVRYAESRLAEVVPALGGHLTVSLQAEEEEAADLRRLRADLMDVAGRVVFNGFPTGVAVTAAQHHGGPFPAASDPRFTSVGTKAIDRFLRPVTFQNVPEVLLPEELQEANPLRVPRRVDGKLVG